VKDWPLLEQAVEAKIEEQAEFVGRWSESVRGKGKRSNSADRGYFVEQAETLTGITHQQVSKWAKRLADRDAYRGSLRASMPKRPGSSAPRTRRAVEILGCSAPPNWGVAHS